MLILITFRNSLMKKIFIATAVATVFVAPTAFGQANNFEGFNLQLSTGFQSNSPKISDQKLNNGTPDGTTTVSNVTGVPLYLGAGYTHAFTQSFTLGGLIEYNPLSSSKGTMTNTDPLGNVSTATKGWVKNNTTLSILPGFVINADTQVYAKLGYTWVTSACSNDNGSSCADQTLSGYSLGLGAKKLIDKNIFVFGEGNYVTLNSKTLGYNDGSGSYKSGGNGYNFLVGAGYKF